MAPQNPETISPAHLATGRAVDQLRRQLGIVFTEDNSAPIGVCPIEGLSTDTLAMLQALPNTQLQLLLTGARTRAIGVDTKARSVRFDASGLSLPELQALADPLIETAPPKLTPLPASASQDMLITLTKYAALLPALLLVETPSLPTDWLRVSASDIKTYWENPPLDIVPLAAAALPIAGAEDARLICLRQRFGTSTHLALIFGQPEKDAAPLVRIHSSCITGDILGSLRCDCGDQLSLAVETLKTHGSGILLYLHQEGRGIGIANKLRAYALQEKGVDTYEANLLLGFDEDERDFSIAAAILKQLNVRAIRLLTNNPQKIRALENAGIKVTERVPLIIASGEHNHGYLEAKAKKSGHWF